LASLKRGISISAPINDHVLAPSNRPVQVKETLALFWRETDPKLKQQLQRRYPKHDWR
jgi:ATP-dependent helicase HrpB